MCSPQTALEEVANYTSHFLHICKVQSIAIIDADWKTAAYKIS